MSRTQSRNEWIADNFREVVPPLSPDDARVEANRCLFCFDAPCTQACPTHIDVPSFIRKIATSNLRGSAKVIMESNPMGPTCSRVCPVESLCEGACVYNHQDRPPIQIGRLQRYATDWLLSSGETPFTAGAPNGRSVGMIGAGPSSLAAAVRLRQWGYDVTLYEARAKGGGLDTYGIVSFRLPPEVALAEVDLVERLGARFLFNTRVGGDITIGELLEKHDAVFVGVGLGVPPRLGIEGEQMEGVLDALPFIERTKILPPGEVPVGRNVVVIGAGNTAVDAATASRRLGADTVTIAYRRSEGEMTCYRFEYEFAKQDGIRFQWLTSPREILGNGRVEGLQCVRTVLGEPDAGGRRRPVEIPGSEFVIACDMVIKAIGQGPLSPLFDHLEIETRHDRIVVDPSSFETSRPRVFAAGDCVDGREDATVVAVVAMALRAAEGIDRSLGSPRAAARSPGFDARAGSAVSAGAEASAATAASPIPGAPAIRPVHVLPSTKRSL